MLRATSETTLRERLVSLTRDLMLMRSSAEHPEEMQRCMEFIGNHLELLDTVSCKVETYEERPSFIALPKGIAAPEVLLNAHIDVVVHSSDDAYHSSLKNGRIYGPGSGDMKGQVAILLELFHEMHLRHPGVSLGLALTSDEEEGGERGVRHLFEDRGLRCGTVMIPDGGSLNSVVSEEKGMLYLRLRATAHAAHAARPWLTQNPLERIVLSVAKAREHFRQWDQGSRWRPTCTVTMLECPNKTINRIPHLAEAVLDVRFPPPWTVAEMEQELRDVLGPDVEVERITAANATRLHPDPLYRDAIEAITGVATQIERSDGASDARYITQYGIPIQMSRPLCGNLHSEDEWIDIASMEQFYRYCERYLERKLAA